MVKATDPKMKSHPIQAGANAERRGPEGKREEEKEGGREEVKLDEGQRGFPHEERQE